MHNRIIRKYTALLFGIVALGFVTTCCVCAQTEGGDKPPDLVPDTAGTATKRYDDGVDTVSVSNEPSPLMTDDTAAAEPPKPPAHLRNDTASIAMRRADDAMLRRFRKDPEFDYSDTIPDEPAHSSIRPPSLNIGGGTFWLYLFAAIAVGCIVYLIVKNVSRGSRPRKAKESTAKTEENTEDIRELDFDALLAQVIASGDLRRAVRIMYLQSLRLMTDRGIIKWNIHTSNREYLYQTPETLRPLFRTATDLFEYVWYGELPVTPPAFERVRGVFNDFNTRINRQA